MIKILMVCYGGGHSKIIEKIYNRIKDEFNSRIEILALTTAFKEFKEKQIPCKNLLEYNFKIKNKKNLEKYIPEYKKNYSLSKDEHDIYNLLGIVDLVHNTNYDKVIKEFGKHCYLPLSAAEKIIDSEKPDLIITTSSPRFEKAMLIIAQRKKIPSIQIEDLFSSLREIEKKLYKETGNEEYIKYYGKYIFTLNEISKKNIIKRGIEENQIKITGNPNLRIENKKISEDTKKILNLKFEKIVLFLSQQTSDFQKILNKIQEISKIKTEILFLIKLHPNQKVEIQEKNNLKVYKENLIDLIKISNLVITEFSTAGLEALLLEKRLIVLQLSNENKEVIPFEKFDNVKIIEKISELEDTIEGELKKKYFKTDNSFLQEYDPLEKIFFEIKEILIKEKMLR